MGIIKIHAVMDFSFVTGYSGSVQSVVGCFWGICCWRRDVRENGCLIVIEKTGNWVFWAEVQSRGGKKCVVRKYFEMMSSVRGVFFLLRMERISYIRLVRLEFNFSCLKILLRIF